jgi:hypothetical protein
VRAGKGIASRSVRRHWTSPHRTRSRPCGSGLARSSGVQYRTPRAALRIYHQLGTRGELQPSPSHVGRPASCRRQSSRANCRRPSTLSSGTTTVTLRSPSAFKDWYCRSPEPEQGVQPPNSCSRERLSTRRPHQRASSDPPGGKRINAGGCRSGKASTVGVGSSIAEIEHLGMFEYHGVCLERLAPCKIAPGLGLWFRHWSWALFCWPR